MPTHPTTDTELKETGARVAFYLDRQPTGVFSWKWLYLHPWECECAYHAGRLAGELDAHMWPR